ncbi:MAG: hypothetical protein LBN29_09590 [Mediterranea sp.]|jgi:hypothetical protein|nr:hypothetical protein [Mediterranea sp.]
MALNVGVQGQEYPALRSFQDLPTEVLDNIYKMGLDDDPVLTDLEGEYLNVTYSLKEANVDLRGKKVAFFTSGFFKTIEVGKMEYFLRTGYKIDALLEEPNPRSRVYVFSPKEKDEAGGYDAAILDDYCHAGRKTVMRKLRRRKPFPILRKANLLYFPKKWNCEIPQEILDNGPDMGRDADPVLTEWEGRYLNAIYQLEDRNIDLRGKKVAFVYGSSYIKRYDKKRYFSGMRFEPCGKRPDSRYAPPPSSIVLYVFNDEQKKEVRGHYDAVLAQWPKWILGTRQIMKRLNKKEFKQIPYSK